MEHIFHSKNEYSSLSFAQLREEKQFISSQLIHVQQQISDLAYNNYRVYADAGSTTECCRKMFIQAGDLLNSVDASIVDVKEKLKEFVSKSDTIRGDLKHVKLIESKRSPLWDILSLPSRMDVFIRAGYYDMAYSIINYCMHLQQFGLTKNPVLKDVVDKVLDLRHSLLNELFNRFAGPIDLASSIQVVNNIRKIPSMSATHLRFVVLLHRDVYLERLVSEIKDEPDFLLRVVDIYRDCMYDTIILHLAIFPENEIVKRDFNADPRWNLWQSAGPSAVLSEWVLHKLNSLFDYIRKLDFGSNVDMETLSNKLMSFALSFGRMGIDFRPQVGNVLNELVEKRLWNRLQQATTEMVGRNSLIIEGEVSADDYILQADLNTQPSPPPVLVIWDSLCVFGNAILEAFNELRNGLSVVQIKIVINSLTKSMKMVFIWLEQFSQSSDHKENFTKAVHLIVKYFIPYLNRCLLILFPFEKCSRPFLLSALSMEQYESRCALDMKSLYSHCSNVAKVAEGMVAGNVKLSHDQLPCPSQDFIRSESNDGSAVYTEGSMSEEERWSLTGICKDSSDIIEESKENEVSSNQHSPSLTSGI